MIKFTHKSDEESCVVDSRQENSGMTLYHSLPSSKVAQQRSSSKSLVEDPLSCVVDSRQENSGMTVYHSLSSSKVAQQRSSSKSLVEDPLSCAVDSRQENSGMTVYHSLSSSKVAQQWSSSKSLVEDPLSCVVDSRQENSGMTVYHSLSSSKVAQQRSSSKSLVEDPLSCVVDSRQENSGMTLYHSLLTSEKALSALKISILHGLKVIFTAFSLLSLTVVANEQIPLYQQLITKQKDMQQSTLQNSKQATNSNAEQDELIALQKRLTDIKKVEPLSPLDVAPFHFRTGKTENSQAENNSGLCVSCHDNKAHSKSVKLRSFLNMHTKTIACQTCHFTSNKYQLTYQWQTLKGQVVAQIDFADKKDHLLVPTYQGKSVVPSKNSKFTKDLIAQWQQAEVAVDNKQQALLWQNIHQPLSVQSTYSQPSSSRPSGDQLKSKQLITCTSCHQQTNPIINLAELGADKQRQQRFEQNIIARFFKRYSKEDDKINLLELLK